MTAPVYVGNYEYDASERDLERTFEKYGDVERVEYKSGFCFVYYKDKRDAEDAIHGLDGREFGVRRRRLRAEFAKHDANVREREKARRNSAEPNKILFVAGFDPRNIRTRDIERAFEEYGRVVRCEIKKTYAFVEYESLADAKEACERAHGSRVNGREITVEYVVNKGGSAFGGGGYGGGGGGYGGGYGGGGGGYGGRGRDDDRYGGRGGGDRYGGSRGRSRSRSRSMDRRPARRSPSYDRRGDRSRGGDRSRSPRPVRRSPSPMRRSPSPRGRRDRTRSRSPYKSKSRSPPPRRSPPRSRSRSRSP